MTFRFRSLQSKVLLLVAAATFLLMNLLQGDVALALLGNEATPQAIAQVRSELGLDQPLVLRFLHWLLGFMQGLETNIASRQVKSPKHQRQY